MSHRGECHTNKTNSSRCRIWIWHSCMAPRGGWGAHTLPIVAWHRQRQEEGGGRLKKEIQSTKKWGGKMRAYMSAPLSARNRNVAVGSSLPPTTTHLFQTVARPSSFISFTLWFTCPLSHFTSEQHITVFSCPRYRASGGNTRGPRHFKQGRQTLECVAATFGRKVDLNIRLCSAKNIAYL